jgi:hypothetical protein
VTARREVAVIPQFASWENIKNPSRTPALKETVNIGGLAKKVIGLATLDKLQRFEETMGQSFSLISR